MLTQTLISLVHISPFECHIFHMLVLMTGSQLWTFPTLSHPAWQRNSIHIHASRCSHKGGKKWWEHFCRSLDPINPCCFNLEQICGRKRKKRAQEIKFLQISIFYYILLYYIFIIIIPFLTSFLFFSLYLQNMPTHTHKHITHISFPLFFSPPVHGLGSKWVQRRSMERKWGVHPSSDSLSDLLNSPLFQ